MCNLKPKIVIWLSPWDNLLKNHLGSRLNNHFGFHVKKNFPQRVDGTQNEFYLEPEGVLPGTKRGYPMGTAE
jgi:hypothetical protein